MTAVLVGATAVRLHVEAEATEWPEPGDPEERWRDLAVVSQIVQHTADLDFVVADDRLAGALLHARGFTEVGVRRWRREAVFVDLIPGEPAHLTGFPLPHLAERARMTDLGGRLVAVVRPGSLIVLKALAWVDRSERRDLADIAVLALRALHERWEVVDDLRATRDALDATVALARLEVAFASPDAVGPRAFADVVRDRSDLRTARSWDPDASGPWERVEGDVRALASDAVRRLLLQLDR